MIRNPFAGAYVKDIAGFMDDLKPLGLEMARSLVAALGGDPKVVEGYGKGAIVGSAANSSMAPCGMCPAAMPCARFWATRKPSWLDQESRRPRHPARRAHHAHQCFLCEKSFRCHGSRPRRSPRADEILLALVMTTGPRVHARVGGLKASEIKGEDGLR